MNTVGSIAVTVASVTAAVVSTIVGLDTWWLCRVLPIVCH